MTTRTASAIGLDVTLLWPHIAQIIQATEQWTRRSQIRNPETKVVLLTESLAFGPRSRNEAISVIGCAVCGGTFMLKTLATLQLKKPYPNGNHFESIVSIIFKNSLKASQSALKSVRWS